MPAAISSRPAGGSSMQRAIIAGVKNAAHREVVGAVGHPQREPLLELDRLELDLVPGRERPDDAVEQPAPNSRGPSDTDVARSRSADPRPGERERVLLAVLAAAGRVGEVPEPPAPPASVPVSPGPILPRVESIHFIRPAAAPGRPARGRARRPTPPVPAGSPACPPTTTAARSVPSSAEHQRVDARRRRLRRDAAPTARASSAGPAPGAWPPQPSQPRLAASQPEPVDGAHPLSMPHSARAAGGDVLAGVGERLVAGWPDRGPAATTAVAPSSYSASAARGRRRRRRRRPPARPLRGTRRSPARRSCPAAVWRVDAALAGQAAGRRRASASANRVSSITTSAPARGSAPSQASAAPSPPAAPAPAPRRRRRTASRVAPAPRRGLPPAPASPPSAGRTPAQRRPGRRAGW